MTSSITIIQLPPAKDVVFLTRQGICADAIAQGSLVHGVDRKTNNRSWTIALRDTIHLLTSNGALVVAATDREICICHSGSVLTTRPLPDVQNFSWMDDDVLFVELSQHLIVVSKLRQLSTIPKNDDDLIIAAKSITTSSLPLPNISDVMGFSMKTRSSVRLIGFREGSLWAVDYDVSDNAGGMKRKGETKIVLENRDWSVEPGIGLHRQFDPSLPQSYLLMGASNDSEAAIFWLDPTSLRHVCRYDLGKTTKLLAVCPLASLVPGTLAVAVADKSNISVVQVLVEETMGLHLLTSPHVVYTIPIPCPVISLCLAGTTDVPGGFNFQCWISVQECRHYVFTPGENESISQVRMHFARGDPDAAELLLPDQSVDDPHTMFHPSELSFHRFKSWLEGTSEDFTAHLVQIANDSESGRRVLVQILTTALEAKATRSGNLRKGLASLVSHVETLGLDGEIQNKLDSLRRKVTALKVYEEELGGTLDLGCPVSAIRSPSHLYSKLVARQEFSSASVLCRMGLLSTEALVEPILRIEGSTIMPSKYVPLLRDLLLPQLNSDTLALVRGWACSVAAKLDDAGKLDEALLLLQTVQEGTQELCHQRFASFATQSPFVEVVESRKKSPRNASASILSDTSFTNGSPPRKVRRPNVEICFAENPMPTILEQGALRGGATKKRSRLARALEDDAGDDDVEAKLQAARCLEAARQYGLKMSSVTLHEFDARGGAQFVAEELVRLVAVQTPDQEQRKQALETTVTTFCEQFSASFDAAVSICCESLLKEKTVSRSDLEISASIAKCCTSFITKSSISLTLIKAALRCGDSPEWLRDFSKEAIAWASCDSAMQSQLEEAARLLAIDQIVIKYCGTGARELFRVDKPGHALKLLDFVCKHVKMPAVVQDFVTLCGAFHHLSCEKAGSLLLCNAMTLNETEAVVHLFGHLLDHDISIAQSSLLQALAYVEELLNLTVDESALDRRLVLNHTVALLSHLNRHSTRFETTLLRSMSPYLQESSVEVVRKDYLRILRLQKDHSIFASLSRLANPTFAFDETQKLLRDTVASTCSSPSVRNGFVSAQRACALLCNHSKEQCDTIWCAAASSVLVECLPQSDEKTLQYLEFANLMGSTSGASLGQIAVVLALCRTSMIMNQDTPSLCGIRVVNLASSLIRDKVMISFSGGGLGGLVKLASILDLVANILTRADEGMGEAAEKHRIELQAKFWQNRAGMLGCQTRVKNANLSVCLPLLHPTWYVGDGLLLPPQVALRQSLTFAKAVLFSNNADINVAELCEVLADRGVYSICLRTLCYWSAFRKTKPASAVENLDAEALLRGMQSSTLCLTERYLGGGSKGITNSKIDSELAVSFLLSLPPKVAFKSLTACLPSAMKTHSFDRLFDLTHVGLAAAKGIPNLQGISVIPKGWRGQTRFYSQCSDLASRAIWSTMLRRHGIQFDPNRLGKSGTSDKGVYTASLIPSILGCLSGTVGLDDVIRFASLFSESFGLPPEIVPQRHIEFLLSPAPSSESRNRAPEEILTKCLSLLPSPAHRVFVLRRCLITAESCEHSNYDLLATILSRYQQQLANYLDGGDDSDFEKSIAESELDTVIRRRDALAVLSAFFQGDKESLRPPFSNFFPGLSEQPSKVTSNIKYCGVVGQQHGEAFDPIRKLEDVLRLYPESGTVTSLAPICLSVGLPSGFLHARSLVVRFTDALNKHGYFPSFENDVVPILDRIRSPRDRMELVEWCAGKYLSEEDRLRCLQLGLQFALAVSTDIEQSRQLNPTNEKLMNLETTSLDTIKRLSKAKETLSDHIRAKTIIRCNVSPDIKGAGQRLLTALGDTPFEAPEGLIEFLLEQGSQIAATLAINEGFDVYQLRKFSSLVHQACTSVAEHHSHIRPSDYAKTFAKKWLVLGDEEIKVKEGLPRTPTEERLPVSQSQEVDEEESLEFVMDLSDLRDDSEWHSTLPSGQTARRLTSDDEPSSLRSSSSREISEASSQCVAVRVAFVLANLEHGLQHEKSPDKENDPQRDSAAPKKLGGILSRIDTRGDSHADSRLFDISQELLNIAFASDATDSLASFARGECTVFDRSSKVATFAMRHRALRAASLLCPQDTLERVIARNGLLSSQCSLRDCPFGAFVAKEIEEMGLPLPHDDLGRLSTMHFLSFARTLWRHHRDMRSRGRFLSLLFDMSLQRQETDEAFLGTLANEIVSLRLARTAFQALETIMSYAKKFGLEKVSSVGTLASSLSNAIIRCTLDELKELKNGEIDQQVIADIGNTIERLFHIVLGFVLKTGEGALAKAFLDFSDKLIQLNMGCDVSSLVDPFRIRAKDLLASG